MTERRFLGLIEVDSGTLVVGDPAYLLPDAERSKPGIDYRAVLEADQEAHASRIGGQPVLLVGNFGGDGTYAVAGEFEDGDLVRLVVDLDPIELEDDE